MVQTAPFKWEIQSPKGHIIQTDIYCHNEYAAIQYIKAYISSFHNWEYKIIPYDS